MSDPSLPLTVTEWEEWGDPRTEPMAELHARLLAVRQHGRRRLPGAVHHRRAQRPTGELPRAGEVDRQAARRCAPTTPRCCMRSEMGAGHGGPSGRYERWRDEARVSRSRSPIAGADARRSTRRSEHAPPATATAMKHRRCAPRDRSRSASRSTPRSRRTAGVAPARRRTHEQHVNTTQHRRRRTRPTTVPAQLHHQQRHRARARRTAPRGRPPTGTPSPADCGAPLPGPAPACATPATRNTTPARRCGDRAPCIVLDMLSRARAMRPSYGGDRRSRAVAVDPNERPGTAVQLVERPRRSGWGRGGTAPASSPRTRWPARPRSRPCSDPS